MSYTVADQFAAVLATAGVKRVYGVVGDSCDVGLPTVWAARYLAMNGHRRLIGSFWHGSRANAMA